MPQITLKRFAFGLAMASLLQAMPSAAQEQRVCPPPTPLVTPPAQPIAVTDDIHVRAERAFAEKETGVAVFMGDVQVEYQGRVLFADEVRYDRRTDVIEAKGDVRLITETGDAFVTPFLHLERATGSGYTDEIRFALGGGELGQGESRRLVFKENRFLELEKGRFTTCPAGEDWVVIARDIDLDKAEDVGVARNARVEFKGVPIFYWPYFDFPISGQRKSGFLLPQVGNSLNSGFAASMPYYWNIAPNMDDTITPRFLTKRGLQVQNELRYLGRTNRGVFNLEYLPNDDLYGGEDRAAGTLVYEQRLRDWRGRVDVRAVSDKQYLNDFGDNLAIASQTHLPQLLELSYEGSSAWRLLGRAQTYQTVDKTLPLEQRPYARLPQLLFTGELPAAAHGPRYQLEGELVNFQHDVRLDGARLTLLPSVSLPWRNAYAFVVPKVGIQHISYALRETDRENLNRNIPIASLDSGLIFERDAPWRDRAFTQTLEPRLFYVYIPYRDQDALPLFDTAVRDFVYANLYRENRFFGGDRVGDTNHVTVGVTSRLLDENAEELLRASIGQIFYLDEQRVNLQPGVTDPEYSPIVGEASAFLARRWLGRASFQWDPREGHSEQADFFAQYRPKPDRVVSLGYRLIRGVQERVELATQWPLSARWAFLALDSYSLTEDKDLESYLGLQYRSCCWAARVYMHRRVGQDNQTARSFMFQFELTGLATLGEAPIQPLQQDAFLFGN